MHVYYIPFLDVSHYPVNQQRHKHIFRMKTKPKYNYVNCRKIIINVNKNILKKLTLKIKKCNHSSGFYAWHRTNNDIKTSIVKLLQVKTRREWSKDDDRNERAEIRLRFSVETENRTTAFYAIVNWLQNHRQSLWLKYYIIAKKWRGREPR